MYNRVVYGGAAPLREAGERYHLIWSGLESLGLPEQFLAVQADPSYPDAVTVSHHMNMNPTRT